MTPFEQYFETRMTWSRHLPRLILDGIEIGEFMDMGMSWKAAVSSPAGWHLGSLNSVQDNCLAIWYMVIYKIPWGSSYFPTLDPTISCNAFQGCSTFFKLSGPHFTSWYCIRPQCNIFRWCNWRIAHIITSTQTVSYICPLRGSELRFSYVMKHSSFNFNWKNTWLTLTLRDTQRIIRSDMVCAHMDSAEFWQLLGKARRKHYIMQVSREKLSPLQVIAL